MSIRCGKNYIHLRDSSESKDGIEQNVFVPMRCKSWDCPICRPIKAKKLQYAIEEAFKNEEIHFLTLTYFQSDTKENVWKNLGKTWNRLLTILRRNHPNLKFVRIVEPHKSGYPHLHIITNCHLSIKEDFHTLVSSGFGYQMMIKTVTLKAAKNYVTKYLTKVLWSLEANNLRKLSKSRIVSCSRNIKLSNREQTRYKLINPQIDIEKLEDYVTQVVNIGKMEEKSIFMASVENGIITIDLINNNSELLTLYQIQNIDFIYKSIKTLKEET